MKRSFDWCYRLYCDRKLYLALIKLQAEKGLTKSNAGLLTLTEGLHNLGFLSDADYEVYTSKYSTGILEDVCIPTPEEIKLTEKAHNKNRQLNRHFSEVLTQWHTLKDSTKQYHLNSARNNSNLKNAKLVIELAESEIGVDSS